MDYSVRETDERYDFEITGSSFIGCPRDHTVLFITGKLHRMLENLQGHHHCLVFVEKGIDVPTQLAEDNCFVFCDDPQTEYGMFARKISEEEKQTEKKRKYIQTEDGYTIGENVSIGRDARIAQGCLIDHDVVIGDRAEIGFGSIIRHAEIGNDFYCGEGTVIGTESFFYAGEPRFRIPAFGSVKIGNGVELGSKVIIERGFNEDTVLEDGVKLDSAVSLGHDDHLGPGVTITCGAVLGGMITVGSGAYIGMNATIKQRLSIGEDALVGMGSVVISNVKDKTKVFGNPATKFGI